MACCCSCVRRDPLDADPSAIVTFLRTTIDPAFIIELVYKGDLAQIDPHMRAHRHFANAHYASGHFVSGRKIPREGGIIVAVGSSREVVESIARSDPFVTNGLADVRISEFRASQRAKDVQALIDGDGR